jgi:osmotically-inducible protein OsmY
MKNFLWLAFLLLAGCQTIMPRDNSSMMLAMQPDRRSAEIIASDKTIEQTALEEIYGDKDLVMQTHVNVNAYNGLTLVTGEVMSTDLKRKVLDIVRVIPHVKMVRDNLELSALSSPDSRADDVKLSEQVRAALQQIRTLPNFDPAMVKVVTENSTVYLMGLVSKEEGTVVINVVRLQPRVKQIVTVFEYIY